MKIRIVGKELVRCPHRNSFILYQSFTKTKFAWIRWQPDIPNTFYHFGFLRAGSLIVVSTINNYPIYETMTSTGLGRSDGLRDQMQGLSKGWLDKETGWTDKPNPKQMLLSCKREKGKIVLNPGLPPLSHCKSRSNRENECVLCRESICLCKSGLRWNSGLKHAVICWDQRFFGLLFD